MPDHPTHPVHPDHPVAPDVDAPIEEHRKHATAILEVDEFKHKPPGHPAKDEDEFEIPNN